MVNFSVPSSEDIWGRYTQYPKSKRYDARTCKNDLSFILFVNICNCAFRCATFGRQVPLLEFYFVIPSRCHSFHHLLHASICPSVFSTSSCLSYKNLPQTPRQLQSSSDVLIRCERNYERHLMPCNGGVECLQDHKTSVTVQNLSLFNLHVLISTLNYRNYSVNAKISVSRVPICLFAQTLVFLHEGPGIGTKLVCYKAQEK